MEFTSDYFILLTQKNWGLAALDYKVTMMKGQGSNTNIYN